MTIKDLIEELRKMPDYFPVEVKASGGSIPVDDIKFEGNHVELVLDYLPDDLLDLYDEEKEDEEGVPF